MENQHIRHLYARAGFGVFPKDVQVLEGKTKQQVVDQLFIDATKDNTSIPLNLSEINSYTQQSLKNKTTRQQYNKLLGEKKRSLNYNWIQKLNQTKAPLKERMVLFWSNHFVTGSINPKHLLLFNNILRKHALGDFRTLTKAVSKSAAMITYLNLNQNKKQQPNENFARELMELFTLGIGNYTEKDIKESARAFTGYKHNFEGNFNLNKKQHDNTNKTFLGQTGNFNGDHIIDIILEQKQCTTFICTKLYTYFVNNTPNQNHIAELTAVFYKNYSIEAVMRHLFMSNWFYDNANIGTKIKSPIDLLVGMYRIIPMRFEKPNELFKIQNLLDQKLFYPPNVAGWKGGKLWITTNSLMLRIKLPSMLLEKESYTIQPKGNFTKQFKFVSVKNKYQEKLDVTLNWKYYKQQVKGMKIEDLAEHLFLCDVSSGAKQYIKRLGKRPTKRKLVKLLALPEYQMC